VIADIQHWAAKSNHQPFKDAASGWVEAIERQVAGDLQAVECLERLDATGDAVAAAKRSLCEVMGLEPDMSAADIYAACEAVFRGFMSIDDTTSANRRTA
jgi:hypothetical protein